MPIACQLGWLSAPPQPGHVLCRFYGSIKAGHPLPQFRWCDKVVSIRPAQTPCNARKQARMVAHIISAACHQILRR